MCVVQFINRILYHAERKRNAGASTARGRMPAYSPLAVANTFLAQYGAGGEISHMKLQKLVYYAYGWWLAYNQDALTTEGPEVWQYGPVFSSLYSACAPFGSKSLMSPIKPPFSEPPEVPQADTRTRDMLDWTWNRYGGLSAGALSTETHKQGSPWQQEAAAHNYRVPRNYRIPDSRIKAFFQSEAKEAGWSV